MISLQFLYVDYNAQLRSVDCTFDKLALLFGVSFRHNALSSFHGFDHCGGSLGCYAGGLSLSLNNNQVTCSKCNFSHLCVVAVDRCSERGVAADAVK